MKGAPREKKGLHGPNALDLCEEAFYLLRRAPLEIVVPYLAGTIPFLLAFLYFWSDMSRGAFAAERCARSAFVLALLFVLMKTLHSLFARKLHFFLLGEKRYRPSLMAVAHAFTGQAILQPLSLFVLPIAAVVTFPLGWAIAFFNNVCVLGFGARSQRELLKESLKQCDLWPKQNHLILLILSVAGLFTFLNVIVGLLALPKLLKMFLGVESYFTLSWASILNTTFLAVVTALTYFFLKPLVLAVYLLRCFHGLSLKTGEDLTLELKRAASTTSTPVSSDFSRTMPAAWIVMFLLCANAGYPARGSPAEPVSTGDRAAVLNQHLDEVLKEREYNWRLQRINEETPKRRSLIGAFIDGVMGTVRDTLRAIGRWLVKAAEWFFKLFPAKEQGGGSWVGAARFLFVALCIGLACALGLMLLRMLRERKLAQPSGVKITTRTTPDLRDENITADQLPEENWLALANDLMQRGELRTALRALFLACLAHLGNRGLISLAKFKSNYDYRRELNRRARSLAELQSAFQEAIQTYELVWYGERPVSAELYRQFETQVRQMARPTPPVLPGASLGNARGT